MNQSSITLLNMTGDVTISWDSGNDAEIRAFVEKKLKEGHSFFIIDKPNWLGRMLGKKPQQISVTDASVLKRSRNRQIVLNDDDAQDLLAGNKVSVVNISCDNTGEEIRAVRRAKTADEVIGTASKPVHTAVMRPLRGG